MIAGVSRVKRSHLQPYVRKVSVQKKIYGLESTPPDPTDPANGDKVRGSSWGLTPAGNSHRDVPLGRDYHA
jgi:hypothetical protein